MTVRLELQNGLISAIIPAFALGETRPSAVKAPWVSALHDYLNDPAAGLAADFPLDQSLLTAFQKKVFQALSEVGPGSVITYGQLAERVGGRRYARAVAQALRHNPFPLVIPCHRVVPADYGPGHAGGYAYGPAMKLMLLEREGAIKKKQPKEINHDH